MQSPKLKHLAFALCLAFLPSSVLAAGLGKLNVMSGLGEPLKADIELLSVTPEELSSITASIASNEAYASQGIDKPASHNDIKIQVTKNVRGTPILKLNSVQPITDAFLDMLIQVDWSSGRLLREYTLLLDPPGYNAQAQTGTSQLPISSSKPQTSSVDTFGIAVPGNAKAGATGASKSKKSSLPKPEQVQASEATAVETLLESQEYTTGKGDTLAKIAKEMKPEGVSLEQMLVGLYQTNPQAFDGKNMNRLKVGQIIRAPSAELLESTTKKTAAKEVRVHSANWNDYKNKLAGIVAESQGAEDAAPTQSSSGKVMAAEDKATPPATGPRDVVKLSGAEASKDGAGDKALQDKLTALQEEAIAKDNALKESQSRTADLEKQIEDMKKLMALKSDAMAKIQSEATTQAAPDAANVPVQPVATAEVPAEQTNPTVDQASPTAPETIPASPAAQENMPAVKPAVTPPEPMTVEQPGILEGVAQNVDLNTLGFAGGGLALLGAGWLYLRNKRKKNLTSFEEGIMTSGGLKANTVFGNTAGGTVDTGDTSFLTDFSQSTSGGMIDSHDVDPIAEAEVYMAYGRDAQAEEILKDAIVKEPKRYELHLKLLEIYQASGNTSAFETISGELYTTLGATDPVWSKVAQLGIKMDPDNPLYKVEELPQDAVVPLVAFETETAIKAEDDFFASFDSAENDVVEEDPIEDDRLNLDSNSTTISNVAEASPFDLDLGALDFDMDSAAQTEEVKLVETAPEPEAEVPSYSLGDLNMDLGAPEPAFTEEPVLDGLPGLSVEDIAMTDAAEKVEEAPKSLDVPTIDFPNFPADGVSVAQTESLQKESLNAPSIFDESSLQEVIEIKSEEISDFGIDLDDKLAAEDEPSELGMSMAEAPSFDLSDINLDLNELSADPAASQSAVAAGEPEEVETKLDLVMAYLDMEDKIGAKELLEEVLKEGGENQRKRASELLEKIS